MKNLVCFTEEFSAAEMLRVLLARILPEEIQRRILHFEGKQDLEKKIKSRIRGWQDPDSVFLVLRDQDAGDCRAVKADLQQKLQETGKLERSVIRIACHELESFYLGDLAAVELGLGIEGLAKKQNGMKFRDPDNKVLHAAQVLENLTQNQYQKVQGSRLIAPHLDLQNNRSLSFQALVQGIRRILDLP